MSYTTSCTDWFTVEFGKISLQVFQLESGEYCLNQAQVEAIVDEAQDAVETFLDVSALFLTARNLRARTLLLPTHLRIDEFEQPIRPILLDVASLFWQHTAEHGNKTAQDFILALMQQSLSQLILNAASDFKW